MAVDARLGATPARWGAAVFAPLWSARTYARLAYLGLQFPLGLAYFIALVVGFAVGGALAWTIPGLAMLLVMVLAARGLGDLEAVFATRLAGVPVRRPPWRLEGRPSLRERARLRLIDPTTWTTLAYLLLHLVQGVATFAFLVTVGAVVSVGVTAPAVVAGWMRFNGASTMEFGDGRWVMDTQPEAWAVAAAAFGLLVLAVHTVNWWAVGYGRWARLMLGTRARQAPPASGTPTTPPGDGVRGALELPAADDQGDVVIGAIAEAAEGAGVAPPIRAGPPPHALIVAASPPVLAQLTPREHEVLLLLAGGYSNAEIAEALVVSEGTVKTHVQRVLAKLGVRDRTQAAVVALVRER